MSALTVRERADRFEETFAELLEALLSELQLSAVDVARQQRGGGQRGKDVQARWRDRGGEARVWHFELKNHVRETVPLDAVAANFVNASTSAHEIDVWCLVLAHAEPGTDLDEALAAAHAPFALRFEVAVLSPRRGALKRLYACHPELYARQYGERAPGLTPYERQRVIEDFGRWLEARSARRPRRDPTGWTRVSRARFAERPDPPRLARAYLRGVVHTCPWEATIHGWAIPRPRIERQLLAAVHEPTPGFAQRWLVGATGEGKSTVLQRVAWRVAGEDDGWQVLWTDESVPASFPADWLDALPRDARVLLVVDGSRQLTGAGAWLPAADDWAADGKRVRLLMADRWHQVRATRRRLPQRLRSDPVWLPTLDDDERDALIARLHARGMLRRHSPAAARAKLDASEQRARRGARGRRPTHSWLVPTVMQLTDRDGRPFETILRSLLHELEEAEHLDALRLLLAIALLHAADAVLPAELGERMLGGVERLTEALQLLAAELDARELGGGAPPSAPDAPLVTHGHVVSRGLLHAAATSDGVRPWLVATAVTFADALKQDYTDRGMLRTDRFDLLDLVAEHLDQDLRDHETEVALLERWVAFDRHGFQWWQRLGRARTRLLQHRLSKPDHPPAELQELAAQAREALRHSLELADQQQRRASRPTPIEHADFAKHRRVTRHSWAVLEAAVGSPQQGGLRLGGPQHLREAVYLALSTFRGNELHATGVLAQALVNLGELELAARMLAIRREIMGARRDHVPGRYARQLAAADVVVPAEPVSLGDTLAAIVQTTLADRWDELDEIGSPDRLRRELQLALGELRPADPSSRALAGLVAGL